MFYLISRLLDFDVYEDIWGKLSFLQNKIWAESRYYYVSIYKRLICREKNR